MASATRHHEAVANDNFIQVTAHNLAHHEALPFSTTGQVLAIVKDLVKDLEEARKMGKVEEKLVLDLQALVAKGKSCSPERT